jgi:hypothetical protein
MSFPSSSISALFSASTVIQACARLLHKPLVKLNNGMEATIVMFIVEIFDVRYEKSVQKRNPEDVCSQS